MIDISPGILENMMNTIHIVSLTETYIVSYPRTNAKRRFIEAESILIQIQQYSKHVMYPSSLIIEPNS